MGELTLRSVSFENYPLFWKSLAKSTSIIVIKLRKIPFISEIDLICDYISQTKILRVLHLYDCNLNLPNVLVAAALNTSIKDLDLSNNQIIENNKKKKTRKVEVSKLIEERDITKELIEKYSIMVANNLLDLLTENKTLERFSFTNNSINSNSLINILKGLESNKTLSYLDISNNVLTLNDFNLIYKMFEKNFTLLELNISSCLRSKNENDYDEINKKIKVILKDTTKKDIKYKKKAKKTN